jgi:hypothetical protein
VGSAAEGSSSKCGSHGRTETGSLLRVQEGPLLTGDRNYALWRDSQTVYSASLGEQSEKDKTATLKVLTTAASVAWPAIDIAEFMRDAFDLSVTAEPFSTCHSKFFSSNTTT